MHLSFAFFCSPFFVCKNGCLPHPQACTPNLVQPVEAEFCKKLIFKSQILHKIDANIKKTQKIDKRE